jgi:class 3 adenylate cyclase/tetratricopeptide (TPR) repeat protein
MNAAGSRFCGGCAGALSQVCAACGAANDPAMRFCNQCGSALGAPATPAPAAAPPPRQRVPVAERRLVSVLFADLVGFTAASEGRDAEATRDLLSRYFDVSRAVITRYGGTVEKFIGDAVMAVWGTPVATESDAERAVRAALELVVAIPELDPGLQARAGVLTGEAAVTIGAEGEGMVAGDVVNTASRIQAAAAPGTVLVGEVTRRSTGAAIVYETAGEHALKGKAEAVPLWWAQRVVSGVGGALKSAGLEAPFVGRQRELRLIKDLFHGCAQDRRAHLVSVTGIAGIGKSRLAWEFYKYLDGLAERAWWQRGRCLAYGDGVAYWALADMVRMRARIEEGEEPDTARRKLRATLEEHVPNAQERAYVEPRVAQLLGLADGAAGDRQDLFAAWRLFFERLADTSPTVLAFEDMQWADSSLLDFVEYLLEWSRDAPIYVITLARPELQERRPTWGAGQRDFTSLYLHPLSSAAMEELLEGLVPGLPERLREQILGRAQGVPLYAVETVRMLLDRGMLAPEGSAYRPTAEIATLEVPETLHALIAARLDGLPAEERRLLQDGAVLGKTFTLAALAALSGAPTERIEARLSTLVRKEVLGVQSDPRSPERGQYGFLQDLVRHVAYETLSRRERASRHLAAAAHIEQSFTQEDEVVEVLASHYLAALEAAPDAENAAAIRTTTREMLSRAGDRAGSVGAADQGSRYYEQAAALADHPHEEAALLLQAGRLAIQGNRLDTARQRLERVLDIFTQAGDARAAAGASAALADVDISEGRLDDAARRLEPAVAQLDREAPSRELAAALAQLGRVRVLAGHRDIAVPALERALTLSEQLALPDVFVEALISRGMAVSMQGRNTEAQILLDAAAAMAHREQLYASALRAMNNLASTFDGADRFVEAVDVLERATVLAARRGDRLWEERLRVGVLSHLVVLGRWDEALVTAAEQSPQANGLIAMVGILSTVAVHCERGDVAAARALLTWAGATRDSDNAEYRLAYASSEARVLRAEGRLAEALAGAERSVSAFDEVDVTSSGKMVVAEGIEAALALGEIDRAEELLGRWESLDPGRRTPTVRGQSSRLRARLDAARGKRERVDERFGTAEEIFGEMGLTFHLAATRLEHAEWLAGQGRADGAKPLLDEARATFEHLRATPWLERADRMSATLLTPAAAPS